jgi:hypothetical protein
MPRRAISDIGSSKIQLNGRMNRVRPEVSRIPVREIFKIGSHICYGALAGTIAACEEVWLQAGI